MKTYRFDEESINFKTVTISVSRVLWKAVWWLLGTLAMAALCYIVLSFFLNTELEKKLSRENRMYEKLYKEFISEQELIGDVTGDLAVRDNEIYMRMFHAEAPPVDPLGSMDLVMYSDSVSEESRVQHTSERLASLEGGVSMVERNFAGIFSLLASRGAGTVPMTVPVNGMNYARAGASVGMKYNPIYKIESAHNGLDIIANQGQDVLAAADGIVADVERSRKGLGNVITLDHGNGWTTRYSHLSEITVRKGQEVKKGKKIATVGVSGQTLAPHLHYEVLLDGVPRDPVNHMFATLSPYEYANVAYVSGSTGQSLD